MKMLNEEFVRNCSIKKMKKHQQHDQITKKQAANGKQSSKKNTSVQHDCVGVVVPKRKSKKKVKRKGRQSNDAIFKPSNESKMQRSCKKKGSLKTKKKVKQPNKKSISEKRHEKLRKSLLAAGQLFKEGEEVLCRDPTNLARWRPAMVESIDLDTFLPTVRFLPPSAESALTFGNKNSPIRASSKVDVTGVVCRDVPFTYIRRGSLAMDRQILRNPFLRVQTHDASEPEFTAGEVVVVQSKTNPCEWRRGKIVAVATNPNKKETYSVVYFALPGQTGISTPQTDHTQVQKGKQTISAIIAGPLSATLTSTANELTTCGEREDDVQPYRVLKSQPNPGAPQKKC
jgi:hypothetical protein